ncbi:MAG: alpha/beta hydrolase [Cyclobacteriaceae bacterium]
MTQKLHLFENTLFRGAELDKAQRAALFIHGRGDTSNGMEQLAAEIVSDPSMALVFPKATQASWYPRSFLAPTQENQPWLDSALENIDTIINHLRSHGIAEKNIFLLGFSQGACLSLEYACRHARSYGGIMALSGGLIGPEIDQRKYQGDFAGTEIFIGCSDVDFHIPVERVHASAEIASAMGASVDKRIYPGMGHHVNEDELEKVKLMLK